MSCRVFLGLLLCLYEDTIGPNVCRVGNLYTGDGMVLVYADFMCSVVLCLKQGLLRQCMYDLRVIRVYYGYRSENFQGYFHAFLYLLR
jgi:hypothetical protein